MIMIVAAGFSSVIFQHFSHKQIVRHREGLVCVGRKVDVHFVPLALGLSIVCHVDMLQRLSLV